MIRYDYSMLRGKIREMFGNEKKFAIALNEELKKYGETVSAGTFNSRINGRSYFKQSEIDAICILLLIDLSNSKMYFFTRKYEFNSYIQN